MLFHESFKAQDLACGWIPRNLLRKRLAFSVKVKTWVVSWHSADHPCFQEFYILVLRIKKSSTQYWLVEPFPLSRKWSTLLSQPGNVFCTFSVHQYHVYDFSSVVMILFSTSSKIRLHYKSDLIARVSTVPHYLHELEIIFTADRLSFLVSYLSLHTMLFDSLTACFFELTWLLYFKQHFYDWNWTFAIFVSSENVLRFGLEMCPRVKVTNWAVLTLSCMTSHN